jgi:hypothetical protein
MYKHKVVDAIRVIVSGFNSGTNITTPLAFDLFATKIYEADKEAREMLEAENRNMSWVNMQPNKLKKGKR